MNRSQRMYRKRQMKRRRTFFTSIFILLLVFIGYKIDLVERLGPTKVDTSSVEKSIELMFEKSNLNLALDKIREDMFLNKLTRID